MIAEAKASLVRGELSWHHDSLPTNCVGGLGLRLISRAYARQCLKAAKDAGLNKVRIGNRSLLLP